MHLLLFLVNTIYGFSQSNSEYKIVNRIRLDGNMGWDYIAIDDSVNRLYESHGNMVQVVDLGDSNRIVGSINNLNGVHGIALAADINKGFISSGKDSSVTVFDMTSLNAITRFKVTGANPDAILYDRFTQRVFTFNGKSNNCTVIDANTNAIITTIDLPGRPEFAVTNGKGMIYDNLEDKSMVCVIDASTMKVVNKWSIAPGSSPTGLAIDIKSQRLFSVCDNKIMVIVNTDNGKVINTVPIGEGPDAATFDTDTKRIYSSNGDGTLTVIQEEGPDKFEVLENVTTKKGSKTCAVNSKTHHFSV